MVDDLADELSARGYSADRIHGGMNQSQRDAVMGKFRSSRIEFLVATDVAARGIDVNDVEAVFNYDLPWDEEDYVHRIGRTGRAGRSGQAISLVAGREIYKLQHIERYTKMRIQRREPPSLEQIEEKRTNVFFERIRSALQSGTGFVREQPMVDRLLEQGFTSTDIACAVIQELRKQEGGGASEELPPPKYEKRESFRDQSSRPGGGGGAPGKWKGSRFNRRPAKGGSIGASGGSGGKPFFKKRKKPPTS
ncbi:MAG: DEAD/DEAH box helicase [Blastochloris sp.]|nr:DEAD/DEAH box helicase [Blastochloris sp.]